jgi:hypothetical protein
LFGREATIVDALGVSGRKELADDVLGRSLSILSVLVSGFTCGQGSEQVLHDL